MKAELTFIENVENKSQVIITAPEGMTEDELDDIVRDVASGCKYDDAEEVARILQEEHGILVHSVVTEVFDSYMEFGEMELLEE